MKQMENKYRYWRSLEPSSDLLRNLVNKVSMKKIEEIIVAAIFKI